MHTITYRYTSSGAYTASDDVAEYTQMLRDTVCEPESAEDSTVWVQNMGNTGPRTAAWTRRWIADGGEVPFLDAATPDLATQEEDKARASRFFIATNGQCVMLGDPERSPETPAEQSEVQSSAEELGLSESAARKLFQLEPTSRAYVRYALAAGLISSNAVQNCVIVPDLYNFDAILPLLRASGRRVRGYLDSPDWHALARAHGVRTTQSSAPQVNLNDKHQARTLLAELCASAELFDPYPFPRVYVSSEDILSVQQVESVMAYYADSYPENTDGSQRVLFAQQTVSAGGDGNYPVFRTRDGKYRVRDVECSDVSAVTEYLNTLEGGVELCPYLDTLESPSVGGCTTPDGTSIVAPIEAVLHGVTRSHAGFRLRAGESYPDNPLVSRFLSQQLSEEGELRKLLAEFGRYLWESGYTGYWSLDIMVFRDASGAVRCTLGEVNLRTTATCNAQMVAVNHPLLCKRWEARRLSISQDDWVPISHEAYERSGGDALAVMQQSREQMLTAEADHGALLVLPPTAPGQLSIDGDTRAMHTLVRYS